MTIGKVFVLALASGGEAGGPLDVNPGLILWTFVTVIFLFFVLKKLAWKPILTTLSERENFIRESLEKAELAKKEAEKLIAENKQNLLKAEEEAQKIIEQGKELAEKLKNQILDESKTQANKIIEDAKSEIQRKNAEAFNKLKEQVAGIAIDAAEKILRETLDREKQAKIVNKYIEDISKN